MSTSLQDLSGNVVNADPTSHGLIVQNPTTASQAGYVGIAAIRDQGAVTGTPTVQAADVTVNGRLRVSLDTPVFQDHFNYSAQNTGVWKNTLSTMTVTYTGGSMVMNAGSSVAASVYAVVQSYRSFPLYTAGELAFEARFMITQAAPANNAFYMGIGIPGTTAAPTDGMFFQLDATGTLKGIVAYNGTNLQTGSLTVPPINTPTDFLIIADDAQVEFWINGVLQGIVGYGTGASTPTLGGSGYAFFQLANSASVPSVAQQLKVQNLQVTLYGLNTSKPWSSIKAGEGLMSYQGQNGGTMGSTALYANSAAPTAAVPTNTTAALGSGLGGNFYETATLAVVTDGVISSYQNPLGSITQTPRNLYITGFRWMSMVQTVLAGGPFVYECGIAFGHTAVTLATAEGAATKASRRFPVGLYTLPATAAVGTLGANFVHTFQTPLFIQPGEFIQTIVRNIGTVGTSGTIAHMIAFEGYWE